MSLDELAKSVASGNITMIHEASIKRVESHIKRDASKSFGIITSFRGGKTKKENLANNKKLGNMIRSLNLGFFKLDGHWNECTDSSIDYKDCSDENKEVQREPSYFIPNISREQIVKLAKKFEQDSVVYSGEDTRGIELISKSGQTLDKLGKFTPNKVAQAFSKVKGKSFVFEGFQLKLDGMMSNMAFEGLVKKYKSLNESSLSRIGSHARKHDSGTISASRYGSDCGNGEKYSKSENAKRNSKLKSLLLAKGYGVTRVQGTYIENFGTPNARPVKETAYIVVDIKDDGNLYKDLKKFGTHFEQDSITFSQPNGNYWLISTNTCPQGYPGHGKKIKLGKPFFGKDGEFYSSINGRPFVFESVMQEIKLSELSIPEIRSCNELLKEFNNL